MQKFGLLSAEQNPRDWKYGGFTPLKGIPYQPDNNWSDYLPVVEFQNRNGFDRMACVSYSILNCLEILELRITGKEVNYSDRFLAEASGTTKSGNYLSTVFDTIRHKGLVFENLYPDTAKSWDEYYKTLTAQLYDHASNFNDKWETYREWVSPYRKDLIREALKDAPLQVTVRYASGKGILNPIGTRNHAVCLFNMTSEYYEIFDHYTQTRKKYSLDYEFGVVLKPYLIANKKPMTFEQNQLVFKTQGRGYNFGIHIDGKLLIGRTDDVMGVWTMRNKDFGNKVSVTLSDWEKCNHYDLKGNKIN